MPFATSKAVRERTAREANRPPCADLNLGGPCAELAREHVTSEKGNARCRPLIRSLGSSCANVRHRYFTFFLKASTSSPLLCRWEALLFYLYTGIMNFAPLTSAGVQARDAYITEFTRTHPHQPRPSSPKSMYQLATKVCFCPDLWPCSGAH